MKKEIRHTFASNRPRFICLSKFKINSKGGPEFLEYFHRSVIEILCKYPFNISLSRSGWVVAGYQCTSLIQNGRYVASVIMKIRSIRQENVIFRGTSVLLSERKVEWWCLLIRFRWEKNGVKFNENILCHATKKIFIHFLRCIKNHNTIRFCLWH